MPYSYFKFTLPQGLDVAIEEQKLEDMEEKEWKTINRLACGLYLKKKLFQFDYVPGITMNDHITNFNQLVTDLLNLDVTFDDEDKALMLRDHYLRSNNLYYYQCGVVTGVTAAVASEDDKETEATRLWHMHLRHAGEKSLQTLAKQGLLKGTKMGKLEHCVLGKQRRVKFDTVIHNIKGILDRVHSDVWGPTKTPSIGSQQYFVTFVDDVSRRECTPK